MIHTGIVRTLFRKDMTDGIRESRVLVSLLTPILLAVLYNTLFPENKAVEAKVAYVGPETSAIVQTLRTRADASQSIDLKLSHVANVEDARRLVTSKDVDVAFVIPDDVDDAIKSGRAPTITLVEPLALNSSSSFVDSTIQSAVRTLAGQKPAAAITTEQVDTGAQPNATAIQAMGTRKYFVLGTVVMMLGMIAILAVPIMLTEEVEKKTLDAVLLIGSYLDVILGKALVGLAYAALAVAVMLSLTRLRPADMTTFVVGAAVTGFTLIGLGLLLGGLFKNAQQVYSWSSVILLPIIAPPFLVGIGLPDWAETLVRVAPSSEGMRIMANGLAGQAVFGDIWEAYAVLAGWAVIFYGILAWRLARRES